MDDGLPPLDASAIIGGLETPIQHHRCICLSETTSTNDEIKRLIREGAPEGTVVTSLVQNGGYGRQGRSWTSPSGGLYLSLLLRPADHGMPVHELPTLSLVAAMAVYDLFRSFSDEVSLAVKWPNDVLCSRGKLCGISLEAVSGAVCVGIGINVFSPEAGGSTGASVGSASRFAPAYLEDLVHWATHDGRERSRMLSQVAHVLLESFDTLYGIWLEEGFAAFVETYNDRSYLIGRTVGIAAQTGEVVDGGVVAGTDIRGNLVLRDERGSEHAVASGEAHIIL